MDPLKKRKMDENGVVPADPNNNPLLSIEDARKILQPFTHEQILEIVQNAVVRHPDVLDAVRSIADRDPAQRKLFIRGLGWDTTTEKLRALFAVYGDLEEAIVILDKATGKSKGYGFVTFGHVDGALRALKEPNKTIDGRVTVTQLASAGYQASAPAPRPVGHADVAARKIYIGNVPYDMPGDRLLQHFKMYGDIEEGPLGFDKASGKSKGYALFVYKSEEGARAALVNSVKNIDGVQVNCKLANDGKKGKPPAVVGQGLVQGTTEGHGNGVGLGTGSAQYDGRGGVSGNMGMTMGGQHVNPAMGGTGSGVGLAGTVGGGVLASSMGGSGGLGGAYGSGMHFGGHAGSTGYGGLGASGGGLGAAAGGLTASGAGSGALAGTGGGHSGVAGGLGGAGSGLGGAVVGYGGGLSEAAAGLRGAVGALGVPGGFSGGLGGPASGLSGATAAAGLSGHLGGLGGAGGGLGGPGGLAGAGGGFVGAGGGLVASGRGLYGVRGMPSGEYPRQSAHYSLSSSSGYQHHQSAGQSPAPGVPPGGSLQGMPRYY